MIDTVVLATRRDQGDQNTMDRKVAKSAMLRDLSMSMQGTLFL